MSWLDDRDITYNYKMPDGSTRHLVMNVKDDAPAEYKFKDGLVGTYSGFEPEEVRQTNIVEYDQNGRKAVRIKNKDGSIQHISKSKLHYMKTGRIENQYTEDYKAHLMKTKQTQMLETEHSRRRGKVSKATLDDVIKNLPDGEYVSDGTSVAAVPEGMNHEKP